MSETAPVQETISFGEDVRVLHIGSVLLDRPIARLRRDAQERRREELREVFCRVLDEADKEGVRLVLISGGLVDNAFVTNDTVMFLRRVFSARPNTHFVIAPGYQDAVVEGSLYRSGRLPRNVHVFMEESLSRFDFDELGVSVYGWAYTGEETPPSPMVQRRIADAARLNLLCGTGELDGEGADEHLVSIPSKQIADFGAHYVALSGKDHDGFLRVGNSVLSSGGRLECLSFQDKREGGVNLVTVRPLGGGARQLFTRRIRTGRYRYAEELLDVSHLSKVKDAAQRLLSLIQEKGFDEKTALRVRLRGSVTPTVSFRAISTVREYGVYALEVIDETVPTDGTDELLHDMTARGELFRTLHRAMTEGTPESRARAARTFRIGYAALCGKDFTRY